MATDTRRDDEALLGDVEAVLEAEWLRFVDDVLRAEFGELSIEVLSARPRATRASARRPPRPSSPRRSGSRGGSRILRFRVSATQRSPPRR